MCLDFASGLSKTISPLPHSYVALVVDDDAPCIAHVAIKVGDVYYDADGSKDKTLLLAEWAYRSGIHYSNFELKELQSANEIRALAKELECEFDSDDESSADEVKTRLEETLDLINSQVQISENEDTVWVHATDGSTVGRFSKTFGMDVHNTVTDQVEHGKSQCLHCTHEPAGENEWNQFCELMKEHHGISVDATLISFPADLETSRERG